MSTSRSEATMGKKVISSQDSADQDMNLIKRLSKVEDQLGRIMYWLKSKHGQDFDQAWDPVVPIPKVNTNGLGLDSKIHVSLSVKDGIKLDLDFASLSSDDSNFNDTSNTEFQTDDFPVKIEVPSDSNTGYQSGGYDACEISYSPYESGDSEPEEKKSRFKRAHRRTKRPKRPTDYSNSANPSRKYVPRSIICDICGISFMGIHTYSQHQAEVHQISKPTLACSKCPKTFIKPSNLSQHYKVVHNETKPKLSVLLCQHCGRSFHTTHSLKCHERVHINPESRKQYEDFAICEYYEKVNRNTNATVRHFVGKEGKSRTRIYSVLRRYKSTGQMKFRKLPGMVPTKTSLENQLRVSEELAKNPGLTCRDLAKNLGLAKSTVSDILVKRLGIRSDYGKNKKNPSRKVEVVEGGGGGNDDDGPSSTSSIFPIVE